MEPPPSYPQATTQDHWTIISSFVASRDLCSAALVCRRWSVVFMSQLWGNPASHFGTANDAVYVALVRFKRILSWARLSTRELTHTLILPPAHAEIYDGPRADWLEKILARLPCLQSLIVSGLPFFDHWALLGLRPRTRSDSLEDPSPPIATYGLRLVEANSCLNTTSFGLTESLKHFPSLVYLDLSRTLPARDPSVLVALQGLPALQILKLRGLGLKDEDVQILCRSIGLRVRSLDLRDNRLTDEAVRMILQECITTTSIARTIVRNRMIQTQGIPSIMQDFFGFDLPSVYRTNGQDMFIKSSLTSGFHNHLGIEEASQTGVTHLYISGNIISVYAVANLLRIQRLHVLDVGTAISHNMPELPKLPSPSFLTGGSEALVPLLEQNGHGLTYLRLNHSVVTKFTSSVDASLIELDSEPLIHAEPVLPPIENPVELEGDYLPIQELPAEPVFELDGSPIPKPQAGQHSVPQPEMHTELQPESQPESQILSPIEPQTESHRESQPEWNIMSPIEPHTESQPESQPEWSILSPIEPHNESHIESHPEPHPPIYTTNGFLNPSELTRPSGFRRNSAIAPEPIKVPLPLSSPILSPYESSTPTITISSVEEKSNGNVSKRRERTYSGILADHDARIQYQKSQPHGLLPSMMPSLRTLVLTNVPMQSNSKDISQNIISFIRHCGEESHWSRLQSQHSYALPPGHTGECAEQTYAKTLFGLRRLILEMSPYMHNDNTKSPPRSPRRVGKSSVEDADCETFWAAAATDFTFFGNDEEECGVPGSEMRAAIPLEARLGKMLVGDDRIAPLPARPRSQSSQSFESNAGGPIVDTLAEISKFRSDKRILHQVAIQRGEVNPVIDGFWDGEVVVVRNA